jgi:hypothetical protein
MVERRTPRVLLSTPVEFLITRHTAVAPPGDALEQLWPQLESARHRDLRFRKARDEIRVIAPDEPRVPMAEDEWMEDCRRTILEIVRSVCEQAELEFDWFAVWHR